MTADSPHVVREYDERDHGALVGNYECPGNPCVHLCTLRAVDIGRESAHRTSRVMCRIWVAGERDARPHAVTPNPSSTGLLRLNQYSVM